MRYAQPPPDTYAAKPNAPSSGPQIDLSAPPTFNTPPPSGYSPAPFMIPASTDSGPPPPTSVFPGSSGQPSGMSPFGQAPPSGMMVPGAGLYQAVHHHWCYKKVVEGREVWYTFSRLDSSRLEEQFNKGVCVCLCERVCVCVCMTGMHVCVCVVCM